MDDRKKREPPDPEGQPIPKKHALSHSTPPLGDEEVDPKEAPVLLYQNKAMQIRIKEMRMELQTHEETIRKFSEKQRLYDETIGCTHRVWDQLNENALKLLSRLSITELAVPKAEGTGSTLAHLLLQTPEPIYDTTEFEKALQSRIAGTSKILQRLVEAVEFEKANSERITAQLKEQASAAIQDRIQQLEAENKNLTTSLNKLQDTQQQSSRTHDHTEAQNRSYQQQIEDLHNKIHQFETELSITRRKVIKQECPLPVGVIAQPRALPTSTTTTTTTTPATNGAEVKKEEGESKQNGGEGGHELADLQAMAEGRLEEATKLREEKVGLLRENTRLKDELAHLSTDRVSTSEPYKRLERETKTLRLDLEREKDTVNRLRAEVNQHRDNRKKDRETVEREESNKRRVLDNQVRELQEFVLKLKTENQDINSLVEKRMASLPSEKYLQELNQLLAARDTDVKKLKEECERLTIVNKQLHERKGDKMEETVQAKLIEVSELTDKVRKLERDIDDYVRKEKSWTARERDYRNMVDNFQASSKDRRDVHDLRTAERRLRDEVDDLRREKDDLRREKDELRRAYEKSQRAEAVREVEKKKDDELKALKADADKAASKANFEIKELKTQLESKTQDYDVMLNEVDSISKAYEDMQTQNKRLMVELGNKEDVTIQVASESMRMKKQLEQTRLEMRDLQERYGRADERCHNMFIQIEELENQVAQANGKFAKAFDELQALGMEKDVLRREARDSQTHAGEFKQQIESLEKSSVDTRRKVEELVVEVEKEREKVRRLEEDKSSLKRKLDRAAPAKNSGGAVNYVEEELKLLKQKLTCNVCNDRMKDTVISKCFHVFCHECVATNLQIRKRRCPQCQAPFSQNDVHSLYGYV